jgi:hypothetical protein
VEAGARPKQVLLVMELPPVPLDTCTREVLPVPASEELPRASSPDSMDLVGRRCVDFTVATPTSLIRAPCGVTTAFRRIGTHGLVLSSGVGQWYVG